MGVVSDTILVTGAGGCIGAWVARLLQEAGTTVVAFDLSSDRRRLALLCEDADDAERVVWERGDIGDFARVMAVVEKHQPTAIIHLAALQVPFCIADPVGGARVNVVGTVNVFEAAKRCGARRVAYASSVAATAMADEAAWKQTLYGAYKVCNEQTARVYWRDAGVASVGIRPSVVYGAARDQGMSSKPTVAMLAAVLGQPYQIPFTGPVGFVHAREAASAFIAAATMPAPAQSDGGGSEVFALNGVRMDVADVVGMIRARYPAADISCGGAALPFPADDDDTPLYEYVGGYERLAFADGLAQTLDLFSRRARAGRVCAADLEGR